MPAKKHTKESWEKANAQQRSNLSRAIAAACDVVMQAQKNVDAAHDKVAEARWGLHRERMALRRFEDASTSLQDRGQP